MNLECIGYSHSRAHRRAVVYLSSQLQAFAGDQLERDANCIGKVSHQIIEIGWLAAVRIRTK